MTESMAHYSHKSDCPTNDKVNGVFPIYVSYCPINDKVYGAFFP